jgi:hypothetical protein
MSTASSAIIKYGSTSTAFRAEFLITITSHQLRSKLLLRGLLRLSNRRTPAFTIWTWRLAATQGYNGAMELVASFAAFGLLVAGWLASGRRRVAAD